MMLKRMQKISLVVPLGLRESVLKRLSQLGVPHLHVVECSVPVYVGGFQNACEVKQLHLEVLVEASRVQEIMAEIRREVTELGSVGLTVSEVFASSVSDYGERCTSRSEREEKWGDFVITV
jgi:hypothetical protein